jgi:hypothetical protein
MVKKITDEEYSLYSPSIIKDYKKSSNGVGLTLTEWINKGYADKFAPFYYNQKVLNVKFTIPLIYESKIECNTDKKYLSYNEQKSNYVAILTDTKEPSDQDNLPIYEEPIYLLPKAEVNHYFMNLKRINDRTSLYCFECWINFDPSDPNWIKLLLLKVFQVLIYNKVRIFDKQSKKDILSPSFSYESLRKMVESDFHSDNQLFNLFDGFMSLNKLDFENMNLKERLKYISNIQRLTLIIGQDQIRYYHCNRFLKRVSTSLLTEIMSNDRKDFIYEEEDMNLLFKKILTRSKTFYYPFQNNSYDWEIYYMFFNKTIKKKISEYRNDFANNFWDEIFQVDHKSSENSFQLYQQSMMSKLRNELVRNNQKLSLDIKKKTQNTTNSYEIGMEWLFSIFFKYIQSLKKKYDLSIKNNKRLLPDEKINKIIKKLSRSYEAIKNSTALLERIDNFNSELSKNYSISNHSQEENNELQSEISKSLESNRKTPSLVIKTNKYYIATPDILSNKLDSEELERKSNNLTNSSKSSDRNSEVNIPEDIYNKVFVSGKTDSNHLFVMKTPEYFSDNSDYIPEKYNSNNKSKDNLTITKSSSSSSSSSNKSNNTNEMEYKNLFDDFDDKNKKKRELLSNQLKPFTMSYRNDSIENSDNNLCFPSKKNFSNSVSTKSTDKLLTISNNSSNKKDDSLEKSNFNAMSQKLDKLLQEDPLSELRKEKSMGSFKSSTYSNEDITNSSTPKINVEDLVKSKHASLYSSSSSLSSNSDLLQKNDDYSLNKESNDVPRKGKKIYVSPEKTLLNNNSLASNITDNLDIQLQDIHNHYPLNMNIKSSELNSNSSIQSTTNKKIDSKQKYKFIETTDN